MQKRAEAERRTVGHHSQTKTAQSNSGYVYDWNSADRLALKTTLVDNKTLTFSPEEYGTRFVIRKEHRKEQDRQP